MSEPQVRLIKSRDFATVHGERPPGDDHRDVHFFQDGLPFDSEGVLLADHPDVKDDPAKQAIIERKLKRAAKDTAPGDVAAAGEAPAVGADDLEDDDAPVNLKDWAMGLQDVTWNDLTQAIALKYKKRVNNKADAVNFLISEGVVQKQQLSAPLLKLAD